MQQIVVPGNLDSLDDIRAFVRTAAAEAGIDEKRIYRLQLAVDEIATNIVTHGYTEADRQGDVAVSANVADNHLVVALSDTAMPYDPIAHPDPADLDSPLEERDIGGLGVFLAVKNVDEFSYRYDDGRNVNTFVMNLEAAEEKDKVE